ncbi:hypothetical protein SEA_SURVIVORS_51 [Gordonia phage Survivors]|uniref:Uncharacterized protein n=1 Tax=Gordonia phage Azira TaxID=3035369 RepID=A0AAF0GJ38_9CAUD|nr:hypothetical protein QLQ73_gp51 [Gordonia phage Azira]UVK59624.1 hypothetical protein SEA_SURVIVORS_51 [Gordonia phage Survivors]WGH21057.1 hypothetical protein SEA_AZIRA_51 [Gordonia phage Azira]WNM75500.1 hypothetical protein SEA_NIBBLES_50 [Gordonia phage Nibbles]
MKILSPNVVQLLDAPTGKASMDNNDADILLTALAAIATESTDPEAVRISMTALYETTAGQDYLERNPFKL